ncbi:MAG: hypothetical protein EA396_03125 [Anaerolineaceae bacterium]|nr:MAG: hypothetical protein EA396_03125 [Anaerolineaceae bacterium]
MIDRSERSQSRKRTNRARARYESRRRRPQSHVERVDRDDSAADASDNDHSAARRWPDREALAAGTTRTIADAWWYLRRNPMVWRSAAGAFVLLIVVYLLSSLFSAAIPRRVDVTGITGVGGLSVAAAADRLEAVWRDDITLELIIDSGHTITVHPDALGIQLDAPATAQAAKDLGFSALPFGGAVEPVLSLDFIVAQSYLLTIADEVNTRPNDARYEIVDGRVVGLPGEAGRRLDTTTTLDYLSENLPLVIQRGRFELRMTPLQADFNDPLPYIEAAQALAERPFELQGYDPVTNQFFTWSVPSHIALGWVRAGAGSLVLDEAAFMPYIDRLNEMLQAEDDGRDRYLQPDGTMQMIDTAIRAGASRADLRVRHRSYTYEIARGDSGFGVARRTGLPYYLIEQANSGRDLNVLSIGDVLNVPSPDSVMPHVPVPHKRIIVDLTGQYLTAFEHGEVVFEWSISSGVRNAPTSPGVFQILSHSEKAFGSSNTLCDSAGLVCGQWEMNWFMGIYEVIPGLENGFHGSVLLPNGGLLGDGAIGTPVTFGCVMSPDEQARMLYEWADIGTTVEIISHEYPPTSDLGRYAQQRLRGGDV